MRSSDDLPSVEERFVIPFYRKMLHANVVRKMDPGEQERWLADFRQAAALLDESTAESLLDTANWRHRLAASWFVGHRGWRRFIDRFAVALDAGCSAHETQGYSVGLALLGTAPAADALCRYLDRSLDAEQAPAGQEWAVAALSALDGRDGMTRVAPYVADGGPWESWQRVSGYTLPLPPVDRILHLLGVAD